MPAADRLRAKLRARRVAGNVDDAVKAQFAGAAQLPTLPGLDSISLATRYLVGGRIRFLEFVQLAALNHCANAQRWWVVFLDLSPDEQKRVSFDDVAAAAGVKPEDLMAEVVKAAMRHGEDIANFVASATHPEVVRRTAKSAMRIGGDHAAIAQKDREILLQNKSFMALPRGAQSIAVNVSTHASANAQAAAASVNDTSVPSFRADMEALGAPRQQVQRQITAAAMELDPIDVDAISDAVEVAR